jgi:hypothetical protein
VTPMNSAVLAVIAALTASGLTAGASLGVVWLQEHLRHKAADRQALSTAVTVMLSRSASVMMRAQASLQMRFRSGLADPALERRDHLTMATTTGWDSGHVSDCYRGSATNSCSAPGAVLRAEDGVLVMPVEAIPGA